MSVPLTLHIRTKRGMPAFGAYFAGSVKTGTARILLNIDALLWSMVDEGERGDFRRAVIDTLTHEFVHALEDHFGLLFDEELVERSIGRVRQERAAKP